MRKSNLVNLACAVALVFFGYYTYQVVSRAVALREESKATRAKIEELTRRKKELESQLSELKNTPAIEREAKERLNMKNSGEEVVVVVPEKKSDQEKPVATTSSFLQRVWNFFGQ